MACVEMQSENMESEREEGEIVDELDDLSDISSEEEFLLRQRLEILENYNNVLERKEAKKTSIGAGNANKTKHSFWQDFTKVPDDKNVSKSQELYRVTRTEKYLKKPKKPKEQPNESVPLRNNRKKYTRSKKIQDVKVVSESSEDSENDEYKNKRRRLADAVTLNKNKVDTSSLKDRLAKMLNSKQTKNADSFIIQDSIIVTGQSKKKENEDSVKINSELTSLNSNKNENITENPILLTDVIDTDDDVKIIENVGEDSHDIVDAGIEEIKKDVQPIHNGESTDEDLESLRQLALKTKSTKLNVALPDVQNIVANKAESEDEDSDTTELRMICLRSALLKKAIEMKKKQKLQKRLSQHSIVQDELVEEYNNDTNDNENNTDIENVDMEIGSDGDEKSKDGCDNNNIFTDIDSKSGKKDSDSVKLDNEDELEEDEDLLRAKLLTSLSKNLPNLVDINSISNKVAAEESVKPKTEVLNKFNVTEEKKFIIKLGDSDSEGEHEATKNLTRMHMKLAEQTEFQLKLDQFLKSTRMEVEKNKLPDVVQPQAPSTSPQKFVPKAMKHLPKSEQIEYKNLVKRMAELEKIKRARQLSLNNFNKPGSKDTLKPRNNSVNTTEVSAKKLEEKIASSRKMIAEESAKMLKLREEATKLSQRYKIVSNELRNITTAITLNKKQQRNVQNGLSKIRLQHQILLKSSPTIKHSTISHPPSNVTHNKILNSNKKQKENDPLIKEHKNPTILKSVKVSVINDLNKDKTADNSRLSVEIDVTSNKKVVKASTPTQNRFVDFQKTEEHFSEFNEINSPIVEKGGGLEVGDKNQTDEVKDYISPLEALGRTDWKEDPHAFLCPFEVGGSCRDTDCKFLHLQTQ